MISDTRIADFPASDIQAGHCIHNRESREILVSRGVRGISLISRDRRVSCLIESHSSTIFFT